MEVDAPPPSPPMDAFLSAHFPVRVEVRPGRGRCLVAARALPAGSVVLASTLPAVVGTEAEVRCSFCFAPPGTSDGADSLLRCSACKWASYCSPGCQRADWPNHRAECKHLAGWLGRGGRGGRGGGGGGGDRGVPVPPEDVTTLLLLGRLQRGKGLREEEGGGDDDGASGSGAAPLYVHARPDVAALSSPSLDPRPGAAAAGAGEAPRLAEHFRALLALGRAKGLLAPPLATPPPAPPSADTAARDLSEAADPDLRLLLAFDRNNFGVTDDLLVVRAAAVAPAAAILNHSCRPNCVISYTFPHEYALEKRLAAAGGGRGAGPRGVRRPSEADLEALAALPPHARARHVLVIRTLVPVDAGEELCHSYVEQLLLREHRQEYLEGTYGFSCTCAGCAAAAAAAAAATASAAAGVPASARLPVSHDALVTAGAIPNTGPFRIGLVRARSSKAARGAAADQDAGGVEHEGVENDLEGMDSADAKVVFEAQEMISAVELAVWLPAAIKSHVAALSALPRSLSREEETYLARRAARDRGLPPGTTRGLLDEVRVLEAALRLLRTLVHPLHVQVYACVNLLHARYMSIGDDRASLAANGHILAFHRHVFALLNGSRPDPDAAPPVHALLALQLFTQGDLLMSLVQSSTEGAEGVFKRGSAAASAAAAAASGEFPNAAPCSPARAAELASLFVEFDNEGGEAGLLRVDHAGARTRPASSPLAVPVTRPVLGRWLREAIGAFREAADGLRTTHGPTHSLTAEADGRTQQAEQALAQLERA
jgi:hypothetical protein